MAGANPLIQVQNTLYSLQFTPYSLVHHHQRMHQHTPRQRAFTPMLHQPSSVPPAPTATATQDSSLQSNMQHLKPPPAAVTAFHRATQRSFSTKRGRLGALHVCIAWKIYYHKQLKKMQQKPNSPHREPTPENPSAVVRPDSVQHERSDQPSSKRANPGPSCGQFAYRNTVDRRETGLSTSSPASATKTEKLEQLLLQQPQRKERLVDENHRGHRTDTTEDLPLGVEPWDPSVTRELDGTRGSRDRKRKREGGSFVKLKRAKRETVVDHFPSINIWHDPSAFSSTHTHPSPCTIPVQHLSGLSVLYPNSSSFNVTRTPGGRFPYSGAEMHPYQAASWEPTWDIREDLHSRHNDYAQNAPSGIRIPLVAQMQKAYFRDFSAPSLLFPRALRKQETAEIQGWDAPVVCSSTLLS
ncbi:uncharacterized protein LOC118299661 isoform X2 [Scophthalmus maximus]|uniref:uncharacterized protein LOC118299661 isoform X2 n=1 Tax=Scophthalmus maximus TaxID=52904 RepID=UPI001FA90D39|nr:uncharacterized protein LOC118299661 isoform X2 [Scophthalmus maximus]